MSFDPVKYMLSFINSSSAAREVAEALKDASGWAGKQAIQESIEQAGATAAGAEILSIWAISILSPWVAGRILSSFRDICEILVTVSGINLPRSLSTEGGNGMSLPIQPKRRS
jgi:hypothetical protein